MGNYCMKGRILMELIRRAATGAALLSLFAMVGCTPSNTSAQTSEPQQEEPVTALGTGGPATDAPLPAWYYTSANHTPADSASATETTVEKNDTDASTLSKPLYQADNNDWRENGFLIRSRMFIAQGMDYADRFTSCVWDCADALVSDAMGNADLKKAYEAASNTAQTGYHAERRITLSSQPVFIGTYASATVTCRAEVILIPDGTEEEEIVYYSSTDNSSTVYDLKNGREVELSDLFFDEVEYMTLLTAQTLGQEQADALTEPMSEDSFDFALRSNSLYLHFVRGNPYFPEDSRDYYISLQQLQGLSPVLYTDFRDVLNDPESAVPCWLQVPVATTNDEATGLPLLQSSGEDVAQQINQQLQEWYGSWNDTWKQTLIDSWAEAAGQPVDISHQVTLTRLGNFIQARVSHRMTCDQLSRTIYDARVWDLSTGQTLTARQLVSAQDAETLTAEQAPLLDQNSLVLTEDCHVLLYPNQEQGELFDGSVISLPISEEVLQAQQTLLS